MPGTPLEEEDSDEEGFLELQFTSDEEGFLGPQFTSDEESASGAEYYNDEYDIDSNAPPD